MINKDIEQSCQKVKFLQRSVGEVTSLAHHDWLILPINNKQTALAFSLVFRVGWRPTARRAATHSNVYDSDPEQRHTPPLHHILVIAAVVCRVGLPAVLEVVSQHVVPAVLWAMGERHWPVSLDLLQHWVVKGPKVLLGAWQQFLLLVCVILGLLLRMGNGF